MCFKFADVVYSSCYGNNLIMCEIHSNNEPGQNVNETALLEESRKTVEEIIYILVKEQILAGDGRRRY